MRLVLSAVLAASFFPALAMAQADAPAAPVAAPTTAPAPVPAADLICKDIEPGTASRMRAHRECHTRAEWKHLER